MANSYNLIREYSGDETDVADDIATSPHWVMAVIRLNKPLSYSRKKKKSITLDVSEGAKLRGDGKILTITSDCLSLNVDGSKEQHVKTMSALLIQSDLNYLVEILPGDWVLAWILHGEDRAQALVKRIGRGEACNEFNDGFKFLGRIESVRKLMSRDRASGTRHTRYQVQAHGFRELDTQIFYDHFMGEKSIEARELGRWLAKLGIDIRDVFASTVDEQKDNVHILIPAFLEILVGTGIAGLNTVDDPELRQISGGGVTEGAGGRTEAAPFAYLVPKEVGDLLGKESRDKAKAGGVLAYADILELIFGVQKYPSLDSLPEFAKIFSPDIKRGNELTNGNHRYTGTPLMGAFLLQMPDFDNRPLWSILQQFLNPVVNEMYTCLRVNEDDKIVPTMVLRQIPFTTDVLATKIENDAGPGSGAFGPTNATVAITRFMSLPRWVLPPVMVTDINIGRSDASRCNFVHVYGQNADISTNEKFTDQIVKNPPIRDDFDIQRSGLHTFMTTVAARQINQVGTIPSIWMEIIADHRIGSQFTLNGSVSCVGIQAPICEGDNLEFDGVVYHIESVSHNVSMDPGGGNRSWRTTLSLTNGLRANDTDFSTMGADAADTAADFPIYPGFIEGDNTTYDPGISADNDRAPDEVDVKATQTPFDADGSDNKE